MALKITQGETLQHSVMADSGSTVTYYFAGASNHTIAATSAGERVFNIAADTTGWAAGAYVVEIRAVLAGITSVLARLPLTIFPALTSLPAGADVRTQAEIAVANIEAMLSGGATLEAKSYKINNRELERYSVTELLKLLAYWKRKVGQERRAAAGNYGLGPGIQAVI